jgi:hypothetical protein
VAQTRRASRTAANGSNASGSRSRGASGRSASTRRQTSRASSNGAGASSSGLGTVTSAVGKGGKAVTKTVAFPVASALAGAAAALALAERKSKRRRKVLGVSIPGTSPSGIDGLAKNIGEAGKQLARLADEVRTGRQKAEEIGKALS